MASMAIFLPEKVVFNNECLRRCILSYHLMGINKSLWMDFIEVFSPAEHCFTDGTLCVFMGPSLLLLRKHDQISVLGIGSIPYPSLTTRLLD